MSDDLEEIERLARAATPGPWHALPKLPPSHADHGYRTIATLPEARGREPLHVYAEAANMRGEPFTGYRHGPGDAALVAHMHPARVLALVARLRRAEEVADVARRVIRDRASGQSHKHYDALSMALAALSSEPSHG